MDLSNDHPAWLSRRTVEAVHERQLARHGGASGLRDAGLLESALMRAVNAWGYGEADLCELAALYTEGIAKNHPFADGNKRTAFGGTLPPH
jgi:death on curing protein